jgi:hypothetical protein
MNDEERPRVGLFREVEFIGMSPHGLSVGSVGELGLGRSTMADDEHDLEEGHWPLPAAR